jgi:hypothetical protein
MYVAKSLDSSVGIATDYGLNDMSSLPDKGKIFFFLTTARTGTHPDSYTVGIGDNTTAA